MTLLEIAQASRQTPAKGAEDAPLTCLLAPLQRVAALRLPGDLSRVAAEAGLSILTTSLEPLCTDTPPADTPAIGVFLASAAPASAPAPPGHVSAEIAELLQSEHPAMQALGCKALVQAYVHQAAVGGGSGDAEVRGTELCDTMARLLRLLAEKESFVYLSALHGFVALAGVGGLGRRRGGGGGGVGVEVDLDEGPRLPGDRAAVVSFLLDSFGEKGQTVRARALCGEGLYLVVRRYGNVFGRDVLARVAAGCLRVCRDGAGSKGGEEEGVLLCASAVSVLAELVASAGPGVAYVPLHEVLDGALLLLARPDESNQAVVGEMRRACAFLLCRCVQGLGDGLLALDQGAVVKRIYQALKRTMRDRDKVVVFHAENSLACLDEIVKSQLLGGGNN